MKTYREERMRLYKQYCESNERSNEASKAFLEKQKELEGLKAESEQHRRKAKKLQMKNHHQKELKRAAKKAEALRRHAEKEKFWPRKVYRVTLYLDCIGFTPTSSRRGSFENLSAISSKESTLEIDQDMSPKNRKYCWFRSFLYYNWSRLGTTLRV